MGGFGNPTRTDGYIDSISIGTLVPQADAVTNGGQMYQMSRFGVRVGFWG